MYYPGRKKKVSELLNWDIFTFEWDTNLALLKTTAKYHLAFIYLAHENPYTIVNSAQAHKAQSGVLPLGLITQRASPRHDSQVTTTCYYRTTVSLATWGDVITLLNVTHRLLYFQLNDTLMTSLLNHNPFIYSPEIYYLRLFS